jgi:uncharacterized protein YycO
MRHLLRLSLIACAFLVTPCLAGDLPLREGDIVFQSFPSVQTTAIELATKSKYSHVGMILRHNGELMVYEAVGPVKFTSVNSWITRDAQKHFLVKRLKNADSILTVQNLAKLRSKALTFVGRPYDFVFNWSDDKVYCSELVWKTFHGALNIDIGKLHRLKDFDLSSPEVKVIVAERYPDGVPLEETVISPQDVLMSSSLITVYVQ